jgi:Trp operon repressor
MTSTERTFKRDFSGNRELVILRDNEKCINCGMTREEHKEKYGRDITVDHIDGNGRSKEAALKNSELENLQTLCLSCHGKKDSLRRGLKLSGDDIVKIKDILTTGKSTRFVAKQFGVSQATISLVSNNKLKRYNKES